MSAYAIALVTIKNPTKFQEYSAKAGQTFPLYGGKAVVKGKLIEMLVGTKTYDIAAVMEFADIDKARQWYDSAEYQACVPVRDEACDMDIMLCQAPEAS